MSEREEKLRELIAKLEKQGCYCDVRAGWSCPMHGYLREVEALLVEPQSAPPSLSAEQVYEPLIEAVLSGQRELTEPEQRNLRRVYDKLYKPVEAEIRDRVLEEAAKIARTHFLQYTGDNVATMELVQAIRALKSQVSVTGQSKEPAQR